MSDDPQLDEVRDWYIAGRRTHNPFGSDANLVCRFDNWLAEHDREVAAKALRDAADERSGSTHGPRSWLRARAVLESALGGEQ